MKNNEEKWAVFWCELLNPIIYSDVEKELTSPILKQIASQKVLFPDGEIKKPSLSTLKRKLKKYQNGGFDALFRKKRGDIGKPRVVPEEVIKKAIELKKEQPFRSPSTINRFLNDMYGTTLSPSTLYYHLEQAGATRTKLGITKKKVRKRWTKDNTHDLWVGDFEEGPYVMEDNDVVPTYLSAFIDCHSRYIVTGRYYLRQNMDVLIDSFVRALSVHGAPLAIFVDNAKVYHSHGLKAACYRISTRLMHRPVGEPESGGIVERFFQTAQHQFEAEVRSGDILGLEQLNTAFSAWLSVSYHREVHTEIGDTPENQYKKGLRIKRMIDINQIMQAFMEKIQRTVHRTFSDVQVSKKYYRVDPRFRGDKVMISFDPFRMADKVFVYSINGEYLGEGIPHYREESGVIVSSPKKKPGHSYLDLLKRQHQKELDKQTRGIDYRAIKKERPFPFYEFAKQIAKALYKKGGLTSFTAEELELLKKTYNQSILIDETLTSQAVRNAGHKSIGCIIHELKHLLKKEN
ncbi:MAG: helix-turn-helix domain-containing protein [bacterium]